MVSYNPTQGLHDDNTLDGSDCLSKQCKSRTSRGNLGRRAEGRSLVLKTTIHYAQNEDMQINLYKTTKRKQRFVKWHLQVSFNQVSKNSSNLGTDWKCTAASTFGKKSISFRPGLMLDIHFMTVG